MVRYDQYIDDVDRYIQLKDSDIFALLNTESANLQTTRDLLERIKNRSADNVYQLCKEIVMELSETEV